MESTRDNAYINTEQFKKNNYSIPTEKDPDLMDSKYFLRWAQYVWSQYATDRTLVPYGGYTPSGRTFQELRAYALGQQDKTIYMDLLDQCDDKNKNEGYLNINWDNVQVMSKFRDIVRGKMITMDFDVVTTAIDETSSKERILEVSKMKLYANPVMQQLFQESGVQPTNVELPEGVESPEDVEIFNKMGGFRLNQELMIQDAIECTNYESGWTTIKNQVVEDIIDLNIAATLTYLEKSTGIVKIDRIAPEELVCRPSKYQDHRDIDYAGFVKRKTLGQLRLECNMSEEELKKIGKLYRGFGGNASYVSEDPLSYQRTAKGDYVGTGTNSTMYDGFSVDVMEFYFIAKEAEAYIMGYHKDGNSIYDKVGLDANLDKRDEQRGKAKDIKEIEYVYRCKWIVGTDYVFDYGKEYAVVRQGHNGIKRAKLPITIYSDRSPSIIERCISFIDDIQLAVLKKRNLLSKMAPGPRMAVDKSLMEDSVLIGNQNYTILDLIELFPKTGVLVYESVGEWENGEMAGSNRPPIQFMPSGVQEDLQILLNDVAFSIEQIRSVTGINEVADGSSQQQDMLVKVMEGLNAATNNALRPHFQLYYGLYENQCRYVAQKWQVSVLNGDIKTAYIPIGDNILKTVTLGKDLYDYDYGIKINLRPTQEDRQMLIQQLFGMQQQQQISGADFFVLYNMITSGDLKKAQLYFAKATAAFMRTQQQMRMQEMQAQSQSNAQAAQVAEQAKMQTMQMEMQLAMQKMQIEFELRMQENEQKHKHKLEQITMQLTGQMEQQAVGKAIDYTLEDQQEQQINMQNQGL